MASSSGFGTPHFRSSASSPLEPPPSGSADSSSSSALDLNNLKQEIVLKILVLGDLGVGKTSLVRRYTEGDTSGKRCETGVSISHSALLLLELELSTFSFFAGSGADSYMVSIDIGFKRKSVEIDGRTVHIQLWDIPGNERFGGMTKVYYKYAHGALIVFDLARPETFENALSWLSDVTEKLFDEKQKLIDLNDSQVKKMRSSNVAGCIFLVFDKRSFFEFSDFFFIAELGRC